LTEIPLAVSLEKRLVHVFTGDGKGKTTAALGAAFLAQGKALKVYIDFFMKGDYPYGEYQTLGKLPDITIVNFGQIDFVDPTSIKKEEIEQAQLALDAANEAMLSGKYDLIILDEVNIAAAWNLVEVDKVIDLIRNKPKNVGLILTGRLADQRIIELADVAIEMAKIKHPFDKGVMARKGIDY